MREVVIVAAQRTAIGAFGGAFKDLPAVDLAKIVLTDILAKINLNPKDIDEVIFGNVLQAGLGQNVARQIAINSGIPVEVPSFTVNKVCGSGLKAVQLAVQSIKLGEADVIVAGGAENMSRVPYLAPNVRWGQRMGDTSLIDSMVFDGLTDIFNNYHMGITAENIAEKYGITRLDQDKFSVDSQNKTEAAIKAGKFTAEITPVTIPAKKGDPIIVTQDEFPRFGATLDSLGKLKPAFKKDGTVTAANASGINDGAAVLVIMSKEKAEALKIKPLATILSYASAGVEPSIMGMGPVPATKKALEKAKLSMSDIDLFEVNEAFAAQSIAVLKDLKADLSKVNVNGGAIALGHPIGASGARILVTLVHEMIKRDAKHGLSTLCIGGGQGIAMVIKR